VKKLLLLLLLVLTGELCAADNVTLAGTGGTSFHFVLTPGVSLALTGTAADFNAARFYTPSMGSFSSTTPPSIGSFQSFSAIPQTQTLVSGDTSAWVAISRSGALIGTPYLLNGLTYKIDFPLPANPTAYDVKYRFYQNGAEVAGSPVTQHPGDGSVTVHLTGLPTNDEIKTMIERLKTSGVYDDGNAKDMHMSSAADMLRELLAERETADKWFDMNGFTEAQLTEFRAMTEASKMPETGK